MNDRLTVIQDRLASGATYAVVAAELGVSRQRVHQLALRAGVARRPRSPKTRTPITCRHCGGTFSAGGYRVHHESTEHLGGLIARFKDTFWDRVDRSGRCWLWTGYILPNGYGHVGGRRYNLYAHRVAYELEVGPVPDGMWILHRCDTRNCVRPTHLYAGTAQDNARDREARTNKPRRRSA